MPHPDGRERTSELKALGGGGDGESLPKTAATGVDAKLAARLGIHEVEKADVRQLLLAWVPDLDGDHVMVPGELK